MKMRKPYKKYLFKLDDASHYKPYLKYLYRLDETSDLKPFEGIWPLSGEIEKTDNLRGRWPDLTDYEYDRIKYGTFETMLVKKNSDGHHVKVAELDRETLNGLPKNWDAENEYANYLNKLHHFLDFCQGREAVVFDQVSDEGDRYNLKKRLAFDGFLLEANKTMAHGDGIWLTFPSAVNIYDRLRDELFDLLDEPESDERREMMNSDCPVVLFYDINEGKVNFGVCQKDFLNHRTISGMPYVFWDNEKTRFIRKIASKNFK